MNIFDLAMMKKIAAASSSGGSSGGTGGSTTAIIDVDSLPTEKINGNAFYRVRAEHEGDGYYVLYNGEKNSVTQDGETLPIILYAVDTLPEVGEPYVDSTSGTPSRMVLYFLTSENVPYLYFPAEMTGSGTGMWMTVTQLDIPWLLVSSPEEATESNVFYIVEDTATVILETLYAYLEGEWVEIKTDFSEFAKKEDIPEVPDVPTKVSELENDSDYVTNKDLNAKNYATQTQLSYKQDKLSFDGTYNASTNKVATVKTVTDAVANAIAQPKEDIKDLTNRYDSLTSTKKMTVTKDENSESIIVDNNLTLYKVSDITLTKDRFVGSKYHDIATDYVYETMTEPRSNGGTGSINQSNVEEGNGGLHYSKSVLLSAKTEQLGLIPYIRIYVVTDYSTYSSETGIPFTSNGIYFGTYTLSNDGGEVSEEVDQLTFDKEVVGNNSLDLENNEVIKSLLARIEALEGGS